MTSWLIKAAAGRILSALPGQAAVRNFLATHVTRTLPLPPQAFADRVRVAAEHADAWRRHGRAGQGDASFFEFGAGWDFTVPLALATQRVGEQQLYDLHRHVRPDLVEDARVRLAAMLRSPECPFGLQDADLSILAEPVPHDQEGFARWLAGRGIAYSAPADARLTGLPSGSVDCVTSSLTLEHIPPTDIIAIFAEMARLIREGGLLLASIDMSDHFSHGDPAISPYHFLRLSSWQWNALNSPLLYQNRLRASWYVEQLENCGFRIAEQRVRRQQGAHVPPGEVPLVHPSAPQARSLDDLLATQVHLVAVRTGKPLPA